ncbi:MAG: hypothetical protein MUC88_01470 [Planctomycetes bacterium]|nr:hypothetical protein [Planctomycetota bacterium]
MYHTPLAVAPEFEFRATPENYRETYPGPGQLPDRIKVWRVQTSPRGSVVACSYGFQDSPDAEIIAVGFNRAKGYGAIGIGRHANFLQWGYGDPPSRMTEAGRRLFINCIHYLHRFDGRTPLVRRRAGSRVEAVAVASALARVGRFAAGRVIYLGPSPEPKETAGWPKESAFRAWLHPGRELPLESTRQTTQPAGDIVAPAMDLQKQFFLDKFGPDLWDKYHADPNGLVAYYQVNLELVYHDEVYRVDEDLRSLGLTSNRTFETLERLYELWQDPTRRELAQRLLDRYTDGRTTFDFKTGRGRIYFSDVGGYKFFVIPEGYLDR